MKLFLFALLFLSGAEAQATWNTIAEANVDSSVLGGSMLILPNRKVAVVSGAENQKIADEIGFAKKAALFREIISGSALAPLEGRYASFPHTAKLLAQVRSLSGTGVRVP